MGSVKRRGTISRTHTLSAELGQFRCLDEREAAALMRFSIKSVQNWRYQGTAPSYVKMARSVRYKLADILDWMELHRVHRVDPRV